MFCNHRRSKVSMLVGALALASTQLASGAQVGTVFVIALENHNFTQPSSFTNIQQLQGNTAAPFLNSLITPGNPNAAQTSYATNYTNAGLGVHPSEPNYVWNEAGTDFGFHSDADPSIATGNVYTAPHLTGLMNSQGVTWNNYEEDVQVSGNGPTHSASGSTGPVNPYYNTQQYNYAPKHNPMVFFSDTQNQNVKTFDQLRSDITNNNFAQYNWITPNQFNDMHSSLNTNFTYNGTTYTHNTDQEAVAIGDNFLSQIVLAIEATNAYKNNGAIVIWNDETEGGDGLNTTSTEIVISPLAVGNAFASNVAMNHSSDIKTLQEIFGLGTGYLNNTIPSAETAAAGGYNTVAGSNDLSSLFQSGIIPTSVPEPTSLGAVVLAGAGMLTRRRRA